MLALVAVIRPRGCAGLSSLQFQTATILIHTLTRFLVNQLNLWTINSVERHARFTGLNLSLQRSVELFKGRFFQIDELGQIKIVKFFEVMSQRRIHLGLTGGRVED